MAPILDPSLLKKSLPLGEVMRQRGLITEAALAEALQRQSQEGGRLGELLVMNGKLHWLELAEALGEQIGIGVVNLREQPCDPTLLDSRARQSYSVFGWLPWRRDGNQLIIAALDYTPLLLEEIRRHVGNDIQLAFVLTSPRDIQHTLTEHFAEALELHARERLLKRFPMWSACRQRGDRWAIGALLGLMAIITVSPFFNGILNIVLVISNVLFLSSLLFKWQVTREGARIEWPKGNLSTLCDDGLPIYTVLVPLYQEASSISGILSALDALDYPKHRLDVKLIIEADDQPTLEAALAARPPAYVDILRVPVSQPRTKPKACNFALQFARGEYVTIYDAEDRPEPDQLRKAVALFLFSPPEVVCLQARLNYYNRHENWLTRFFSIEYALLFDRMIPGLYGRGIPIPLGGTSNHMALRKLRRLGAWDPFNVTEDADLGLRLATAGFRTVPLDSLTLEEAPLTLGPWLRQRSRWIKGYLMTWIVHTRAPGRLLRHCGPVQMAGLQFMIGGASIIYLITPLTWAICFIGLFDPAKGAMGIPAWLHGWCIATLGLGMLCQWHMAWSLCQSMRWKGMKLAVLGFPFYWILHSVASFKALWQLLFAPFYWEKTQHGLTSIKNREVPHQNP